MSVIFFNLIANSSKPRALRSTLYSANILVLLTKLYFAYGIEKYYRVFSKVIKKFEVSKIIYLLSIPKKSLAFSVF